jgi:hypothetical protein
VSRAAAISRDAREISEGASQIARANVEHIRAMTSSDLSRNDAPKESV